MNSSRLGEKDKSSDLKNSVEENQPLIQTGLRPLFSGKWANCHFTPVEFAGSYKKKSYLVLPYTHPHTHTFSIGEMFKTHLIIRKCHRFTPIFPAVINPYIKQILGAGPAHVKLNTFFKASNWNVIKSTFSPVQP